MKKLLVFIMLCVLVTLSGCVLKEPFALHYTGHEYDPFPNGLIRMMDLNGKYGYLNAKGKVVIDFQYDKAYPFYLGTALVKDGIKYKFIDTDGQVVKVMDYVNIVVLNYRYDSPRYYFYQRTLSNRYGLLNYRGEELTDDIYEEIVDALPHLAPAQIIAVKKDGKYGFITSGGEEITDFIYDDASVFYQNRAAVQIDGKYGYIDINGNMVIAPEYSDKSDFDPAGHAFVTKNFNEYALIDISGNVIMDNEVFAGGAYWKHDIYHGYAFKRGNKITVYDRLMQERFTITAPKDFRFLHIVGDYIVTVSGEDFKHTYYQYRHGRLVKTGTFSEFYTFYDFSFSYQNLALAKEGSKTKVIGEDFDLVIPEGYRPFAGSVERGLLLVIKDGKVGIMNNKGKVVVTCKYDDITPYGNYFFVLKDGKVGVMNSKYRIIIPIKYASSNLTGDSDGFWIDGF